MLDDLDSAEDIAKAADRLLRAAGVLGVFPTPVEPLVEAARLRQADRSLLAPDALSEAPPHVREAVAKVGPKIHAILDRRAGEIHLHPDLRFDLPGRRAFKVLHEVGHQILPWQTELAFADDESTLSPTTHLLFEREANQAAAEVLFQCEIFRQLASDREIGMSTIVDLSKTVGASIRATLRRYAETHARAVAALVLDPSPTSLEPLTYRRREVAESKRWRRLMSPIRSWPDSLAVPTYDFLIGVQQTVQVGTPLRVGAILSRRDGERCSVEAECLFTGHCRLMLFWL